jgi:hypothetical protein
VGTTAPDRPVDAGKAAAVGVGVGDDMVAGAADHAEADADS